MTKHAFLFVALATSSAAAQSVPTAAPGASAPTPIVTPAPAAPMPVAPPAAPAIAPAPTCTVTFSRAPDDVRAVVEKWVAAEARCNARLDVRIIPTDGGLYLLARDDYGRIRERIVPDAQSAGVLIASWVAADVTTDQSPYDVRQPPVAQPMIAPAPPAGAPAMAPPPVGGPGAAEGLGPSGTPVLAATAAASPPAKPRWLGLGAMVAMSGRGGGGLRGEWDIKARRWATFGIAASLSASSFEYYDGGFGTYGYVDTADQKLVGYLALSGDYGKWHLRTALGLGAVYTHAEVSDYNGGFDSADGLFPTGELTFAIGRNLGERFAVFAGPIISVYAQEYNVEMSSYDYYGYSTQTRGVEAMMYAALRYRL